jgi:hypothetical protein
MQHSGEAELGPKMLRISGKGAQGLGRSLEQQVVEHRFVLIGDVADLSR